MRIISGDFRRRQLNSPPGLTTRPIPDRVKESFYSMLGTRIEGAMVVDLFCGSGSFGLEAVSRGAKSVMLVERDRRIAQVVQSNIDLLKCQDRAKLVQGDALGLAIVARIPKNADLVFMDPPYDLIRQPGGLEWDRVRQQATAIAKQLAPDGFFVVRTPWPFIFDSPEVAKRREQLKLLAQGKLRASTSSRGGPMPKYADDIEDAPGARTDRRGGKKGRNRGKGSGGRNDLLRGPREEHGGHRAARRAGDVTADGDGWLDPEQIRRELEKAGMQANIAGLDDGAQVPLHEMGGDPEQEHDEVHDHTAGEGHGADAEGMTGEGSEEDLLAELGLDPDTVRKAGGLRAFAADAGEEELDRLLAEAHKQANAEKHFGDLKIAGLRGPETHVYGSTAVHWYMAEGEGVASRE